MECSTPVLGGAVLLPEGRGLRVEEVTALRADGRASGLYCPLESMLSRGQALAAVAYETACRIATL